MYQALYRKYRPDNLNDIVGQKVIINTLINSIKNKKISHAYLFTGPRGTGKTSVAKAFAKLVNCENSDKLQPCNNCISCIKINKKQNTDIIEIDAASNNGVDEIREIKNKTSLMPTYSKYKIYIIDEVHMLTIGAFNALLKTLEEPPAHVIFILATTEPHKIPATILSRCQRFDFKRITNDEIVERLKYISEKENILIEESALFTIAKLSDGGMRDSISLLDQVVSYSDSDVEIKESNVHDVSGTLSFDDISEFAQNILKKNLEKVLELLKKYDQNGINMKKFTEQLIKFFEEIILSKETPKYFKTLKLDSDNYKVFENFEISTILNNIELLTDSLNKISNSTMPKILLEICLIKMIEIKENYNENKTINLQCDNKNEMKNNIVSNVHNIKNNNNEQKNITYRIKDYNIYEKFKEQRINNVLADLNKSKIIEINKYLEKLKLKILDHKYGKYISLLLDSNIKATSKEGIIFVFEEKAASENFNENIPSIELLLSSIDLKDYKIISTYLEEWNIIKNEFNSKQKKYDYDFKIISEDDVYEKVLSSENEIQEIFNDCIEYI